MWDVLIKKEKTNIGFKVHLQGLSTCAFVYLFQGVKWLQFSDLLTHL